MRDETGDSPTCAYPLVADDVIIGVTICQGTLRRADYIFKTWYQRIPTKFMGHSEARGYDIMITGVDADDYGSTLGKGFYGLAKMYEDNPNLKWYGLLDDDCFLYPDGLLTALSAFDPNKPWAFSQSDMGMVRKGGPTVWRMFGGAGIILSNAMVKAMHPTLRQYCFDLEERRRDGKGGSYEYLLDVALPRQIHSNPVKQEYHRLYGLHSQTPGFYLNTGQGKRDLPNGLPEIPITFHYTWGEYVYHLDYILNNVQLCAPPATERNSRIGVGALKHNPQDRVARERTWGNDVHAMLLEEKGGRWGNDLLGYLVTMYEDMPGKEWYMFMARSDVYVVEPNLRHLTAQMDPRVPHLVGRMPKGKEASKSPDPAHGIILSGALMAMIWPLANKTLVPHPPFNGRELAAFAAEKGATVYHVDTLLISTQPNSKPNLKMEHESGRTPNPHCTITIPATPVIKELKAKVWDREKGVVTGSVTIDYVMRQVHGGLRHARQA